MPKELPRDVEIALSRSIRIADPDGQPFLFSEKTSPVKIELDDLLSNPNLLEALSINLGSRILELNQEFSVIAGLDASMIQSWIIFNLLKSKFLREFRIAQISLKPERGLHQYEIRGLHPDRFSGNAIVIEGAIHFGNRTKRAVQTLRGFGKNGESEVALVACFIDYANIRGQETAKTNGFEILSITTLPKLIGIGIETQDIKPEDAERILKFLENPGY